MLSVPRSWSELTPGWMTAALADVCPGALVEAVEVDDVADGTNSRARVRLRYASGAGPERVFVKREGRMFNRLALTALGAREAESRLVASGLALPLEHPAFYAAAVDRRRLAAVTVMEDVTLRGARPNDATVALDVDQVRTGLLGLARMHAAYWGGPLPDQLAFVRPWQVGRVWAPVSWTSLARALRLLRTGGHGRLIPPGVDAGVVERGFRGWATIAAKHPRTLLHGDPHLANTYALPSGVTGFYDWQLIRTGNWSHDVGYFLVSSLSTADRRDHERDLLADYLTELAGQGAPAPDFAEAWALYRQTPVFGLGTWLHTLSGGGFQPLDVCLAVVERFATAHADHTRTWSPPPPPQRRPAGTPLTTEHDEPTPTGTPNH
ncbi:MULTISPECIES: phosphotransferase [unclassified Frankia]|uniref:phosphotransferase n=1 Tax=unclassified Frankia TaxID=2632575 RepID=UPI0027DAE6D2|nr:MULTISPECIES: phosphotransferase [unclassified Frankia]